MPFRSALSALSPSDVGTQLASGRLAIRTGEFNFRVRCGVPEVAEALTTLYADFPVVPDAPFFDFHVRVDPVSGPRRWLRPQVLFWHDGYPPFLPLPRDQAYPMLEWGMNWCISTQAHHRLMIHAAVLERGGRAVIMPAPPGSGKSTLTAALAYNGWRLLSDELALISPGDGLVHALARPVSLKNASIGIIRDFVPGAVINRESRDTAKGTVAHLRPPRDAVLRMDEPARPAWIVFPRWEKDADAWLDALPTARSFMRVADNAFNYSILGTEGFRLLARVVEGCDAYDFTYGRLEDAIRVFDDLAA